MFLAFWEPFPLIGYLWKVSGTWTVFIICPLFEGGRKCCFGHWSRISPLFHWVEIWWQRRPWNTVYIVFKLIASLSHLSSPPKVGIMASGMMLLRWKGMSSSQYFINSLTRLKPTIPLLYRPSMWCETQRAWTVAICRTSPWDELDESPPTRVKRSRLFSPACLSPLFTPPLREPLLGGSRRSKSLARWGLSTECQWWSSVKEEKHESPRQSGSQSLPISTFLLNHFEHIIINIKHINTRQWAHACVWYTHKQGHAHTCTHTHVWYIHTIKDTHIHKWCSHDDFHCRF